MIQKLFPLDKNYLLRQAQTACEEELVVQMVEELKVSYTQLYNPLRLMDPTFSQIMGNWNYPKDRLRLIYRQLCGVYRYRHGDNQLELLFDGRTHLEKFQQDWHEAFLGYIRHLGQHEAYVKTMLRMTLLFDTETRAEWAENHCKAFINHYFELKVVKRQGELLLRVS
ncbi:MAG: hypothetical protein FJZ76_09190 [Bacteroidetes bacterium]|nr:hypothetical protein [Bacteroidota bacterium]